MTNPHSALQLAGHTADEARLLAERLAKAESVYAGAGISIWVIGGRRERDLIIAALHHIARATGTTP